MFFERRPGTNEITRGETFDFPFKTDARADTGTTTIDLYCRDAADDTRGWECPVVLDWERRPPNLY